MAAEAKKQPATIPIAQATTERDRIIALARDLFVKNVIEARTADHIAVKSFEQAEAFWRVADSR